MTTQVVRKQYPLEQVGNVVSVDGRLRIIEYSDLPDDVPRSSPTPTARSSSGPAASRSMFSSACFSNGCKPRRADCRFTWLARKLPHIDPAGKRVEPQAPNAIKFERFIFDLLPSAERAIVVEIDAARGFAPVKNAPGEKQDTPEAVQAAMIALHTQWLRQAGATVEPGVPVEIGPLFALDAAD